MATRKKVFVFAEDLLRTVEATAKKYSTQFPVLLALDEFLRGNAESCQKDEVLRHLVKMMADFDKEVSCKLMSIYCKDNHDIESVLMFLEIASGNSTYEAAAIELLQIMEEQHEIDSVSTDNQILLAIILQKYSIQDAKVLAVNLLSKASEKSKKAELKLSCYLAEFSEKPYKIDGLSDVLKQFAKKHPEASYALAIISLKNAKQKKKGTKKYRKHKNQAIQYLKAASKSGYREATERLLTELNKDSNKFLKTDEIHRTKKRLKNK